MTIQTSLKCPCSGFSQFRRLYGRSPAKRGFTLAELSLTMGIVLILAMLAAPVIRVDKAEADATAFRVRAAMQNAQRTALVQQTNVMVSFDTVRQRIRIVEDKNDDKTAQSGERATWQPLEGVNAFSVPPKRVNGTSTTVSIIGSQLIVRNSMPTVVYRRDGSLSSDLEIYLVSRRNGNDSRRAVIVSMGTGRADWYRHLGGTTWRLGGI